MSKQNNDNTAIFYLGDILDHHIHTKHRTETGLHHNRGSCDQEITWPNNKGSAHKPCSFCHRPVTRYSNNYK